MASGEAKKPGKTSHRIAPPTAAVAMAKTMRRAGRPGAIWAKRAHKIAVRANKAACARDNVS